MSDHDHFARAPDLGNQSRQIRHRPRSDHDSNITVLKAGKPHGMTADRCRLTDDGIEAVHFLGNEHEVKDRNGNILRKAPVPSCSEVIIVPAKFIFLAHA